MDIIQSYLADTGTLMLTCVIVLFPLYGLIKGVPVYESFVTGAKDGFTTAITILPYLIAILFAFAMFRASGAMDALTDILSPVLNAIAFPPEVLPMAIARPLSGGGSMGILTEVVKTHGVNSEISAICATIYASTETTFYVLAVYFGAVSVRRTRHAVATGLIADVAAIFLAIFFVRLLMS